MALYPEPPSCRYCGEWASYGDRCAECEEERKRSDAQLEQDCADYDGPWDVNGQDVRAV